MSHIVDELLQIELFSRVLVEFLGDIQELHRADTLDQVQLVGVLDVDVVSLCSVWHLAADLAWLPTSCLFFLIGLGLLLGARGKSSGAFRGRLTVAAAIVIKTHLEAVVSLCDEGILPVGRDCGAEDLLLLGVLGLELELGWWGDHLSPS